MCELQVLISYLGGGYMNVTYKLLQPATEYDGYGINHYFCGVPRVAGLPVQKLCAQLERIPIEAKICPLSLPSLPLWILTLPNPSIDTVYVGKYAHDRLHKSTTSVIIDFIWGDPIARTSSLYWGYGVCMSMTLMLRHAQGLVLCDKNRSGKLTP